MPPTRPTWCKGTGMEGGHLSYASNEVYASLTIFDCRETKVIDRIAADGRIVYRDECWVVGHSPASRTPRSVHVPSRFARGLASGRHVKLAVQPLSRAPAEPAPLEGLPVAIFADEAQKELLGALGWARQQAPGR